MVLKAVKNVFRAFLRILDFSFKFAGKDEIEILGDLQA